MHSHDVSNWSHDHHYAYGHERESERRTSFVVALTGAMMVAEITCGFLFNSMALLADGWHMATHTLALGVGVYAYRYARLNAKNTSYTFGTGKVHALGGFTSALFLGGVGLYVLVESLLSIYHPKPIQYDQAILVAGAGFLVNAISIWLLHSTGDHDHGHHHDHSHHHNHEHDHDHDHAHEHGKAHDINFKAAYAHVVVDAMTSIFAVAALLTGKYFGWAIMDPIVGIVGAFVIGQWAYGLIKTSTSTLLDRQAPTEILERIRSEIQADGDSKVSDLHVWQVAPGKLSAIISVVAHNVRSVDDYKSRLQELDLAHVTIELNQCTMH